MKMDYCQFFLIAILWLFGIMIGVMWIIISAMGVAGKVLYHDFVIDLVMASLLLVCHGFLGLVIFLYRKQPIVN